MQDLVSATRVCALCRAEKPVSGVWYLLAPARAPRAARFACEGCFKTVPLESVA